jgi:hypothetical protein
VELNIFVYQPNKEMLMVSLTLAVVLRMVLVLIKISLVQLNIIVYQPNKEMPLVSFNSVFPLRRGLESGWISRWLHVTTNWRTIKV